MKITLELPDGVICGFFNCVEQTNTGMQLAAYQLGSDDMKDGTTIKLPRERRDNDAS